MTKQRGIAVVQLIWIIAGVVVILAAALHVFAELRSPSIQLPTPYQAVLLSNGSVYFGHLP